MKNSVFVTGLLFLFLFDSCKKETKNNNDLEVIKSYQNQEIQSVKFDSVATIELIIKQKLQEVFDLATLNQNYQKELEVDSLIVQQLYSYFYQQDSNVILKFLNQIDSLRIKQFNVSQVSATNNGFLEDSVGRAKFDLEFYQNNQRLLKKESNWVDFILSRKSDSDSLFHIYITALEPEKDTILVGETQ